MHWKIQRRWREFNHRETSNPITEMGPGVLITVYCELGSLIYNEERNIP